MNTTTPASPSKRSGMLVAACAGWRTWTGRIELWGEPIVLLAMRLWMASIWFNSGLTRVAHWDSQVFLFSNIHPLPGVPALLPAVITTGAELSLSVLLAFGLFGRLAALGMLIMAMVIQFIVANTPAGIENQIGNSDHYMWMLLLAAVVVRGPGLLSVDHWLAKWFAGR